VTGRVASGIPGARAEPGGTSLTVWNGFSFCAAAWPKPNPNPNPNAAALAARSGLGALSDRMPVTIFETSRLVARHLEEGDLEDMLAVYGDEDAMRWVGDGRALTRAGGVEWLGITRENYRKRGYGMSAIVWRASGEIIGFCGLVHPGGQLEPEIKYAFKRSHWGKGVATEAARAMLAYGARSLGLHHVIATTAPENLASHRVLLKAGMVRGELLLHKDGSSTQLFEWHAQEP